ncbi:MAG: hypothetical protein MJZ12_01055 [Prevotella sp.]|nr:hypothetical protein [Prevotella sp.]
MKRLIYIILVLACAACGTKTESKSDRELIGEAIAIQMKDYPQSTLKDVYKNFFQDAFGPGHLMSDAVDAQERMTNYLRSECESAKTDVDPSPYYVKSGWHGRFYRVNLSVINEGKVPFDVFLSAFMESARNFVLPEIEDWSKEWTVIEEVFREKGYEVPGFSEDSTAISNLLKIGEYASHHSEQYEKAYHPHYRLIEKSVFEDKILPLLR